MQADEAAVYDFGVELVQDRTVSDAVLDRLRAQLSEQQVVDLVAVTGFYATVAMILNTVDAALPDGEPLPLPPLTTRL
jgi:alkylhydroperoxidase family enzyme